MGNGVLVRLFLGSFLAINNMLHQTRVCLHYQFVDLGLLLAQTHIVTCLQNTTVRTDESWTNVERFVAVVRSPLQRPAIGDHQRLCFVSRAAIRSCDFLEEGLALRAVLLQLGACYVARLQDLRLHHRVAVLNVEDEETIHS